MTECNKCGCHSWHEITIWQCDVCESLYNDGNGTEHENKLSREVVQALDNIQLVTDFMQLSDIPGIPGYYEFIVLDPKEENRCKMLRLENLFRTDSFPDLTAMPFRLLSSFNIISYTRLGRSLAE